MNSPKRPTPMTGKGADIPASDDLSGEVGRWVEAYIPQIVPRPLWESKLRQFVVPAVLELRPLGLKAAYHAAWSLTHIGAWSLKEGLPLERDAVLDPDAVERFMSLGLGVQGSPTTRQLIRTTLRRIGPRLTSKAPWEPPSQPLARHVLAPPYTADELQALTRDAQAQSTAARRRAARALLALGNGAGLDGRWAGKVRGTDILVTPQAVLVRTGPPSPREVPCLARYEAELVDLAAIAVSEPLIAPRSAYRNRINSILQRLEVSQGSPRLSPSRLRTTWIVHHVAAGTRLPELSRAAGVSWMSHPRELLGYVTPLPEEGARQMLRGRA